VVEKPVETSTTSATDDTAAVRHPEQSEGSSEVPAAVRHPEQSEGSSKVLTETQPAE
jgi:hypothetical protein